MKTTMIIHLNVTLKKTPSKPASYHIKKRSTVSADNMADYRPEICYIKGFSCRHEILRHISCNTDLYIFFLEENNILDYVRCHVFRQSSLSGLSRFHSTLVVFAWIWSHVVEIKHHDVILCST